MDALDLVRVCLRRWYVMLPVILLALGAGMGLAKQQKPEYSAYANYALIYAQTKALGPNAPDPRNRNPLAANGGTLLGEALVSGLMTPVEQQHLGGVGTIGTAPGTPSTDTEFTVSLPDNSQTYNVATWGPSEAAVRHVVARVLAVLRPQAKLLQDQAGAPANSRYYPFVTTKTQVSEVPPKSPMKRTIAVVAVGMLAGGALCIALERVLAGRQQRREKRTARERKRQARVAARDAGPRARADGDVEPGTLRNAGRTRKVASITGIVPESEEALEETSARPEHVMLRRRSG